MTPCDRSYSRLAWELARYATFSTVDAIDGRNVQAGIRHSDGAISYGYGRTSTEALQDLARTLDTLQKLERALDGVEG